MPVWKVVGLLYYLSNSVHLGLSLFSARYYLISNSETFLGGNIIETYGKLLVINFIIGLYLIYQEFTFLLKFKNLLPFSCI